MGGRVFKDRVYLYGGILYRRLGQRKPRDWVEEEAQLVNGLRGNVLSLVQLVSIGLGSTIGK